MWGMRGERAARRCSDTKPKGKRSSRAHCSDPFTHPVKMHGWDTGRAADTMEVWKARQQAEHPCPWVADALVQETD